MLSIKSIHHIAIICKDYPTSKKFYTETLGFNLDQEHYRAHRDSYKADLSINGRYTIELFSFPNPPNRTSRPEAAGLRHLAFAVEDIDQAVKVLTDKGVEVEPIRVDKFTNKRFTFFADPDDLPLELYEV